MHRETLVYRSFLKGQLEVEEGEDQRYQATEARAVAVSPAAADAAAEFASAAVAIAAPCDDADRTAGPRRTCIDREATICPSHRTGLIDLVCS